VCSSIFVAEFKEEVRTTIPATVECLRDSDSDVREAAIELLSMLAARGMWYHHFPVGELKRVVAEFREDLRIVIPTIGEHLKDSDGYVRNAAIELLSRLATQGMCWHHFSAGLLMHVCS